MNALFDRIEGAIRDFGASRALVLRWSVDPDERPWITKTFEDRFPSARYLALDPPLAHIDRHGIALANAAYSSLSGDAVPRGAWRPPSMANVHRDVDALALVLDGYVRSVAATTGKMLVVDVDIAYAPNEARALGAWWSNLIRAVASLPIRFVVCEARGAVSAFDALSSDLRAYVRHETRPLGVPEALEAFAEVVDGKTPEGRTRSLLLKTMHACKRADDASAMQHVTEVSTLATSIGRPDLAIPGWFSVGALAMARADYRGAVDRYRRAEQHAEAAKALGLESSGVLHVQSRMGTGAALFGGAGYELAGRHFLDTIPIAAAVNEVRLEVECARLAGEALTLGRRHANAFDAAVLGLTSLARTDQAERPKDAGRELGLFLIRATASGANGHHRAGVQQQLERLLGAGWDRAPT